MWNEDQREILTIDVGGRKHKFDPLPLLRRYRAGVAKLGGAEHFRHMLEAAASGTESVEQGAIFFPTIYEIMGWVPFAQDPEQGYTEGEALIGLTQFLEWVIESKKKEESSPLSASSDGGLGETPPTTNTADSSSVEESSNQGEPGKLQLA